MKRVQSTHRERRLGLRSAPDDEPRILVSPRWQRWLPLATIPVALGVAGLLQASKAALWRWLGRVLLGGAAVGLWGIYEALVPKLERVTLTLDGLPAAFDGLRIAHLSDFHLDEHIADRIAARAIRRVLREQPDLILFTGDFVTNSVPHARLRATIGQLHAPLGVWAVWGNHDYWFDINELRAALGEFPITVLENQHVALTRGAATLYLAGTDDLWEGHTDLDRALAGLPAEAPVILLAHEPDLATAAAQRGILLQLSGHAHGGHIALPWLGALFLPRYARQWARDLHRVGPMWLYVNRGLGGYLFRLGARAEVTLIELRCFAN
ncbi:MAG: metallophosphoesterase [Herpetosiphonaceae bacterium]|nr:metallophosphoesterase [Herpetosiphonaceae bacterium]